MISSTAILQGIDVVPPRRSLAVNHDGDGERPKLADVACGTPERVYIASPISTYQTPRYDRMLTEIAQHYPRAEILQARHLFQSTADWRRRWPQLLPTLTGLVFFSDVDSTIGLGVWSEIQDAADRIPVWFLDDDGRWHSLDHVAVHVTGQNLSRFATVQTPGSFGTVPVARDALPKGGA